MAHHHSALLVFLLAACTAGPASAADDYPFLPPLLVFNNGTDVKTPTAWRARRDEVASLLETTILGTRPVGHSRPMFSGSTIINRTTTPGFGGSSIFVNVQFTLQCTNGTTQPYLGLQKEEEEDEEEEKEKKKKKEKEENNNKKEEKEEGLREGRRREEQGGVETFNFDVEVIIPHHTVVGRTPLFLTQWNHREWALIGVARGYIGVVYPAADTRDVAPALQTYYRKKGYTMMLIAARALVASLTLDYLLDPSTLSGPVLSSACNASRVFITGHSRNGKQSLVAAAFDERFTVVVGSSPGAPISSPYHFSSHNYYGEGPDGGQAGHWWLPSIINYTNHPERLPMDGHGVLGLIAPRACAVATGYTDREGDLTFSDEMGVQAAHAVYRLLLLKEGGGEGGGAGGPQGKGGIQIIHRPGDHHGFDSVNSYFDFADTVFGRLQSSLNPHAPDLTPSSPDFISPVGFNWTAWNSTAGRDSLVTMPGKDEGALHTRLRWMLQLASDASSPSSSSSLESHVRSAGSSYNEEQTPTFTYTSDMLRHTIPEWVGHGVERQSVSFGDYLTANVYYQTGGHTAFNKSRPAVVWLHPYSYASGFVGTGYGEASVVFDLAAAGYTVLAYDQIGFASRLLDGGATFYGRFGGTASLMGHMVQDALSAVDFLRCRGGVERHLAECGTGERATPSYPAQTALDKIPFVDTGNIYLVGYSLGGNVALHAAALAGSSGSAIAGVASFSGFSPLRTDTNDRPTGGIRRLYSLHALVPRLGLYATAPAHQQHNVPYDYDEIISTLCTGTGTGSPPMRVLLHTPQEDRDATFSDVQAAVDAARAKGCTKQGDMLVHVAPADKGTVMESDETALVVQWLHNITRGK